jgi:alanine racemase
MSNAHLRLTIDRAAIKHNLAIIRAQIGPSVQIAPVIKADGYGLGLETVVQTLKDENIAGFYVANIDEGVRARAITTHPIYIFSGIVTPDQSRDCAVHHLTPVINSLAQLSILRATTPTLPFSLHVDTGMNRLGLAATDLDILAADQGLLRGLHLQQLLSHFIASEDVTSPRTADQAARFDQAIKTLAPVMPQGPVIKTLANSSGVIRGPRYHYDLVRPGYALYGGNPTPETHNPMRDVVRLQARILQVRKALAGDTVGYNATHTLTAPTTILTLGGGYADGLARALSNRGVVYAGSVPCPIIGRVSMDLITCAWPAAENTAPPQAGDWVDIIGPGRGIDAVASTADTIGYQILTQLSHRAERVLL